MPRVVAWLLFSLVIAGTAAGYGERVWNANLQASGLSYLVDMTRSAAQSFTPAESFVLQNVTLKVENVGISQSDALNVAIQTDAGNQPSGTVLGGSSQVRSGSGWLDFPFTPAITLTVGTTYWMVATSGELAAMGYGWFHAGVNQDVVPGRALVNLGLGWVQADVTDLAFVTYGLRLQPEIIVGIQAGAPTVDPGGVISLSVSLNNTGALAAPTSWVNVTFPPELAYESDTVTGLGGAKIGPSEWTIPNLGNGPHSFTIVVRAGSTVVPGTSVIVGVHLDHTNALGGLETPSSASATVIIGLKEKPLYLASNGGGDRAEELRAAPPAGPLLDFDSDSAPGLTIASGSTLANAPRWTLAPPFARDFHLRGLIRVLLYLDSQVPSDTIRFNVTILDRGIGVTPITASSRTVAFNGFTDWQLFSFDVANIDYTIPQGNALELAIFNEFGGDAFVAYNGPTFRSRVLVLTETYIAFDQVTEEDINGPTGLFSTRDTVYIRANVSDPLGSGEVAGVTINMTDPDGLPVATQVPLSFTAADPALVPAWKLLTYALANPAKEGTYAYLLTAREGNGVERQRSDSFQVRIPILDLEVAVAPTNPTALDVVAYTVYANNTGQGGARAWVNVTIPSGLAYVADTSGASGGTKTGNHNWTFLSIPPGPFGFTITVQVGATIPGGTVLTSRVDLAYGDEKGFPWSSPSVNASVAVTGVRVTAELAIAPSAVHSQEGVTISVWFNNSGNADSPSVWLNLTLPSSVTYVSDGAGALPQFVSRDTSGNPIRYRFSSAGIGPHGFATTAVAGALTPGELLNFLLVEDYALHVGGGTARSTAEATAIATGPLLTAGVTGPSVADPGDVVGVLLSYNNSGNEDAQAVWVNLTWDIGLVFANSNPLPLAQGPTSATWKFATASLGPHSISVAMSLAVGQADATDLRLRGSIDYSDALGGLRSSPGALHIVRVTAPVFDYGLTSEVTSVEGGDVVRFTLAFANAGSGVAASVWANLTLSDSLTFLDDDAPIPETVAGAVRIWRFRDVSPGPHEFHVNASVSLAVIHGDILTTLAGFNATDANDNVLPSDVKSFAHTVSTARVTAGISLAPSRAAVGSTIAYRVYVNNTGGRASAVVWINDTFDTRLQFLGDTSGLSRTRQGDLFTWIRLNLVASERFEFEVTVRLVGGAVGDLVPNDVAVEFTNARGLRIGAHRSPQVIVEVVDGTSPTADAGLDQIVNVGTTGASVRFDGTGSTDNVGVVNYTWNFVISPTAYTLYGTAPTFVFAAVGTYVVTLTVRDAAGNTGTDGVVISVRDLTDPTADAGPDQTVEVGTTVNFNGAQSRDNVGVVNYTWTFTAGGQPYTKYGPTPNHVFAATGSVIVTLTVQDAAGNRDTDTLVVILQDTTNPTANAGPDQTVEIGATGATVTFDGTGSTDNGGVANYTWTLTLGGIRFTLYGPSPSQVFPSTGTVVVTLDVRDAVGNLGTDSVTIRVQDTTSPIARAGPDQTIEVGTTANFNGAGSTDVVGIVNYTWTFTAGGRSFTKYGPTSSHVFTTAGEVLVTLTVRDAAGNAATDTVRITVVPASVLGNPLIVTLIAASIAAPSATFWYWRYRRPWIEKALLVTKDGLLLYHVSRTLGSPGEKDEDLLSGMLAVVQDFIKDAFDYTANRELDTVEFGDYHVIIERGDHVFLAVVTSGNNGAEEIRKRARRTVGEIEAGFGEILSNWKGDMNQVAGVRDIVKRLLGRR